MRVGLTGGIEKTAAKFESQEINAGFNFEHESVPVTFKVMRAYRTNRFDKYASLEALKNELMPSHKLSFIAEHANTWENMKIGTWAEFGIPSAASNFIKVGGNLGTYYPFWNNRFRIGYDFTAGFVKALSLKNSYVPLHDRFFLWNEYGYNYVSHTEPAVRPFPNLKRGEELVGDDLGTTTMLAQTFRFSWMTIPFLKDIKLAPVTYVRMSYYPKKTWWPIHDHLRISSGVGIGFYGIPGLTLVFYYNLGNLIPHKGDYEREGFGFNVALF